MDSELCIHETWDVSSALSSSSSSASPIIPANKKIKSVAMTDDNSMRVGEHWDDDHSCANAIKYEGEGQKKDLY